ncbi:replication protein A 70 kDa DNA-binding subunit B-like isoform X2 [Coffea arabica]|uniref:Replication protein A 70 kDa DNA-binding subunit B-like isoform X2 n=1 Tax=Coffea arabica TaxID=13443 RepID=A0ABM4W0K0_COFAR
MTTTRSNIETKCVLVPDLTDANRNWFAKLVIIEKSPIRYGKDTGTPYQKYIFADASNNTIQASVYDRDIEDLDPILQLHCTYYIGNAWITKIASPFFMASSPYQLTISKRTFIHAVPPDNALPYEHCYQFTPFHELHSFIGDDNTRISILCVVIHALPPRTVPRGNRYVPIQEFVVLNEEKRPLLFTMWEEFLPSKGAQLKNLIPHQPIIIIARPKVNTHHTISIGTQATSIVIFNPQIPQAALLKQWITENTTYMQTVTREKLYDKAHQRVHPPIPSQLREIYATKPFWIKAEIRIRNNNSRFYFLSCPNPTCMKPTGADIDTDFTCFFCRMTYSRPLARLRFETQLCDNTGLLIATIEDDYAESILQTSVHEVIRMEQTEEQLDIAAINSRLQNTHYYIQVRNTTRSVQFTHNPRYIIVAYLPILPQPHIASTTHPSNTESEASGSTAIPAPTTDDYTSTSRLAIASASESTNKEERSQLQSKHPLDPSSEITPKRHKP